MRQIGAVAELPRSALVARFGAEGELLHDRARGVEVSPFRPRRAPERLALALRIEPAVAELDPLRFVLHRLAGRWPTSSRPAAPPPEPISACPLTSPSPRAAPRRSSPWSSASPSRPPTLRRSSGSSSPVWSGRRRLPRSRGSSWSWPASSRPSGSRLPLFVPQAARNARLGWLLARLALTFGRTASGGWR